MLHPDFVFFSTLFQQNCHGRDPRRFLIALLRDPCRRRFLQSCCNKPVNAPCVCIHTLWNSGRACSWPHSSLSSSSISRWRRTVRVHSVKAVPTSFQSVSVVVTSNKDRTQVVFLAVVKAQGSLPKNGKRDKTTGMYPVDVLGVGSTSVLMFG